MNFVCFEHHGKGKKLLKVLEEKFPDLSYSTIQKILRQKDVKINGARVHENIEVQENDQIQVYVPNDKAKNEFFEPDVVFEDQNIIVCNKPVQMETITQNEERDLTFFVNKYLQAKNSLAEPVHRIDRNTQGLVVFAKNDKAREELLDAFKRRTIKKYYLAWCAGIIKKDNDKLVAFLKKDEKISLCYVSDSFKPGYKKIETAYRVLKREEEKTLVEVELLTGRTHQIRAHFAHIGFPLLGDGKYGQNSVNKKYGLRYQALVNYKLVFSFSKEQYLSYLDKKIIEIDTQDFCNFKNLR